MVSRLQDALGIRELSDATVALIATLGITLAASTVILPEVVASVIGMIMGIIGVVSSAFTAIAATGGIYSTAMGTGSKYDKAEDFAHDATMLVVSLIGIWGSVTMIKNNLALYKGVTQNLAGRTTRPTPSEVVNNSKGARMLSSMDELLDYTKGFLDDDALQYVKEVLNNDGDDIAQLKKIAQLVEEGSRKIGKKLSKEELKAGLDALWNDGGVEGALAMMERVVKLASVPREKKLALGVDGYLDDFAKQRNAHTWRDFPDTNNWKQGVRDAISDPDTEIVFNLDEIDKPLSSAMRAASGRDDATAIDWELSQIYSNPKMWNRVTWYKNGSIVPNPLIK